MQQSHVLKTALLVGISFFTSTAYSQQSLNVAGNTAKINGMTFEYSIGEMVAVSTERNANLIVTQGLLQPTGSSSVANNQPSDNALSSLSDQIKVYPNPTTNLLFVETMETAITDYAYNLFDATGKTLLNQHGQTSIGLNKFTLDLSSYAAGSYYLVLQKNGESVSYKIQKLN
jgi:hypothetical protein